MALIVEQHVVADMYPVSAAARTTGISAGMAVALNAAGEVIQGTTALKANIIGIAGDSLLTAAGQTTAYSAQVTVGSDDADTARRRWTANRVSDAYDETLASGKMTVYNGARMYNNNMFIVGDTPSIIAYKYPANDMKISGNSGTSIVAPDGTLISPPSGSSSFSLASVSQPTFTSPTTSAVYVQTDCTKGSETINLGLKRFMWSNIWAIGAGVEMYYYQVPSVLYVCLQPSDNTYNFNVDFVGVYDKTNQTEYGQYKRRPGVVTDAYIECVSDVWRMRLGGTNNVDSSGTIDFYR